MKFFAVLTAILASALAAPSSWTITEVSQALQDPSTNPALIPFLENALNEMMAAIHAGYPADAIQVAVPVVSSWSLQEISEALQNPATNPALVPYLEQALNEIMDALVSGQQIDVVPVIVPADLAPVEVETPIVPVPVPSPPAPIPSPEATPNPIPASSSPLVQIIINVSQQGPVPSPVVEAPQIVPTPVTVVENAEESAFNPIDTIHPGGIAISPIAPGPVIGPMA